MIYVKNIFLQAQEIKNTTQFKISLPTDFVKLAEWEKGDLLRLTFVIGEGRMIVEKQKKGD